MFQTIRTMSKAQKRRVVEDWVLITPQLLLFLTLTIIPFFVAIPVLFTDRLTFLDTSVNFIGFDNFKFIFTNPRVQAEFWPALWRTIRFTILNYGMVYVFGLTLALLMYEIGFRGGFFTVIYLPWIVSGLALGYMAVMLFARSTGTVNLLLLDWGLIEKPIDIKQAGGTTYILPLVVGWRAAGYNLAIFLSGLLGIPKDTIEAAVVDGASYLQRLWRVYFPQMIPSFIIATLFCIMGSFRLFDILVALGALYDNPEAEFLSVLIFNYGFRVDKLALGMTMSVEVGIPLLIIGIWLQYWQRRLHRT